MKTITDIQSFLAANGRLTVSERIKQIDVDGVVVSQVNFEQGFLRGLEKCLEDNLPLRNLKDGIEYIAGYPDHITLPDTEVTFEILRLKPIVELYKYCVKVSQRELARYELFRGSSI